MDKKYKDIHIVPDTGTEIVIRMVENVCIKTYGDFMKIEFCIRTGKETLLVPSLKGLRIYID